MNHFFYRQAGQRLSNLIKASTQLSQLHLLSGILMLLMLMSLQAKAQTAPASIVVSGGCLDGNYVLTKAFDDYDGTGKPAYSGKGSVTIGGTTYADQDLTVYYVDGASAWVLAFGGQPYQANYSTATIPPTSGWEAVTDGALTPCPDSNPLGVVIPVLATVTTADATNVQFNSATLGGNVTADGGASVTERGVVYVVGSGTPTTANTKVVIGSGTGTFSQTVTGLQPNTLYSVRAYAINSVGTSYGNVVTFTTPLAPTTVTAISRVNSNPTNANTVTFTVQFASSISGISVSNFSLTTTGLSGASVATVSGSGTTYTVTVNTGTGDGTLRLNLANATGLTPSVSNVPYTSGQSYTIDKTAPNTTITANPPALTNSTNASFSFTGTDDGGSGIASFQVSVDGNAFVSAASPFTITGLADGSHTFQVRAIDAAGNVDPTPATYSWTVDATPPAPPVVSTPADGTPVGTTTPTYTGTAEPNTTVTVYVDGTSRGTTQADASGNWSFLQPTTLALGSHTVFARATDAAGNTSSNSTTNNFTVTLLPTVTTATPTNVASNSATLGGDVTNNGGANVTERGVVYSSSNSTPTTSDTKVAIGSGTGSFSQTVTGLQPTTTYYVRAYAVNGAGTNYGSVQQFTTTAVLSASISSQTNVLCNKGTNGSATVAISGGTTPYSIDWTPGNPSGDGTTTITGLGAGSYTVTVTDFYGATAQAIATISEPPALVLTVSPSTTTVCGGPVTLTASSTNANNPSFAWTGTSPTSGPTVTVSSTGIYSVTLTDGSGCQATASATVTINPVPTPTIEGLASAFCKNATAVNLVGNPAGGQFTIDSNGATALNPSLLTVGQHTVVYSYTNSSGCSNTVSQTVTINALPVVSITNLNAAYCKDAASVPLTGSPMGGSFTIDNTGASELNPATLVAGQHTVVYSYTDGNGCSNTASQTVTINDLPVVSITGLANAYCQDAAAVTLAPLGSPQGGTFTIDGSPASVFNPAVLAVGNHQVVYRYSDGNGCTNQATQTVTVKETPTAPTLVTQAGGSYPAGVSNLTISQNVGNVILTVSGCSGGTISWNGGSSTTLAVSTSTLGTQSFTATCSRNGCTSPTATATVTVVVPTLKVLSRDPDNGQLNNNTIKPYLLLQNTGTTPIDYSTITLRYWLTVEDNLGLIFQKNYVQIGQNNLNLRYVPLNPARQGATGYIEYTFNAGAGSLAPMGDSGPLEIQVYKENYSSFFQGDDYSYINNSSFTLNPRITAYQNGTIFYGVEPGANFRVGVEEARSVLAVKVLGNPVVGQSADVEISGVSGQAVELKLIDLQGKLMHGHSIPQAGPIERVRVPVGSGQSILLLEVSTSTQRQQIKLLRP